MKQSNLIINSLDKDIRGYYHIKNTILERIEENELIINEFKIMQDSIQVAEISGEISGLKIALNLLEQAICSLEKRKRKNKNENN